MAQFFRKAGAFLGLVSDDEYESYTDDVEDYSEPIYRSESGRRSESGKDSSVVPINRGERSPEHPSSPAIADMSRIISLKPSTYNDARTIGEHFRDGVPVIINLTEMDDPDAKRLVDFSAGLIFGLQGTIERVTTRVFLLSPNNVNVTAEDKERIKGGFYNQS